MHQLNRVMQWADYNYKPVTKINVNLNNMLIYVQKRNISAAPPWPYKIIPWYKVVS